MQQSYILVFVIITHIYMNNCDNNITLFDKHFNKKIAPFQKEKHCDIITTIELNFFTFKNVNIFDIMEEN